MGGRGALLKSKYPDINIYLYDIYNKIKAGNNGCDFIPWIYIMDHVFPIYQKP